MFYKQVAKKQGYSVFRHRSSRYYQLLDLTIVFYLDPAVCVTKYKYTTAV